jgi:uncharacterized protein YjiS (DUF1127 family)
MKTSIQRIAPLLEEAALPLPRATAPVTRLRAPSVNDRRAAPPALGVEAWPWHLVPPTRSADADAREAVSLAWPLSSELHQDAQRRRAAFLGGLISAGIRAVGGAVRRAHARYRQRRTERATYVALHDLDDRSLRDLGFSRDEIRSVAAELAGRAEYSRRLARPTWPTHPSLFDLLFRQ